MMASGNASATSAIEISQPAHTVVKAITAIWGCRNWLKNWTEFHFCTQPCLPSQPAANSPQGRRRVRERRPR